jgi:glutamine amidotransferase
MLAILDYKAGNQTSVLRACDLGHPRRVTADHNVITHAEGVIFPGEALRPGHASTDLHGMDQILRRCVEQGMPLGNLSGVSDFTGTQ